MTYYTIAGQGSLDSDEIVSRLNELRELRDEKTFVVFRVRNGEEIEKFDDLDEAEQFISDEDYDPERVQVRADARELDDDEAEELEELEQIDDEGSGIFSDWGSIIVQRESEVDAEDYAREYIRDNYLTSLSRDLFNALEDYVNFRDLGDSLLEDVEGGEIAGYNYVYL